jgi:nucleotide-binding universal stress UspA family protein
MHSTALVATDLSSGSDGIVECAHTLRALGIDRVLLLHALGLKHMPEVAPLLARRVEGAVDGQTNRLRSSGLVASARILPGPAAWEIPDLARRERVSWIILGPTRHPRRPLRLSSLTLKVLRQAPCPVIILHPRVVTVEDTGRSRALCHDSLRHVLFGFPDTIAAQPAVRCLEELSARGIERVTLMHMPTPQGGSGRAARDRDDTCPLDRARLEHLRTTLLDKGVAQVDIETVPGCPVEGLLDRSRQDDASMIMLGLPGRRASLRHLVGAMADQVATIDVPVILVPQPSARPHP